MKLRCLPILMSLVVIWPCMAQRVLRNTVALSEQELNKYQIISKELWAKTNRPPAPPYPPLSKAAHFFGKVPVLLAVDTSGKVLETAALKADSYHPSVALTALTWATTITFPSLDTPDAKVRFFRIYVYFAPGGQVRIQPTAETQFE